jgi:CheY-like chemotaxis protein/HPt (histidine-containing phosphotransfer) domain-containing protein
VYDLALDVPTSLAGDVMRLRQILLNLIGNAIKFTERGKIALWVEHEPDATEPGLLRFSVSDTGIGIPQDKLDAIFESFTQVDSSTSRKYGGTGLGLAISKRLVELMGGRIWVESVPEKGTTFYFTARLRVRTETPMPAQEARTQPATHVMAGSDRELYVLVADDSIHNRMLLQAYLRSARYIVDIVENGAEAVGKVQDGHYDVVLMDMQMPVMDGYTATRAIRQWEQSQNRGPLPIIALTAHALSGDRNKCLEAGCTGYLAKPIKKEALFAVIAEHTQDAARSVEPERKAAESAVTVRADPEYADLIREFMQAMRSRPDALAKSLHARDYQVIRMLGHQMNGEGGTFGFDAISTFGAELEKAAFQEDDQAIHTTMEELSAYLKRVRVVYDHKERAT